jgi:biotin carboxyl carrier protein
MKLDVQIGGRLRKLELEREGARLRCAIDGRRLEADAVYVAPGVYSILLDGRALEVRVHTAHDGLHVFAGEEEFTARVHDPRSWRGKHGHAIEAEGRQQIVAPMPGKVVRLLVKQGDTVEAGKGLLVVEAMKMQNEIRAPKSGTVERLLVAEGQAVTAGEVLAVVG